LQAQGWTLCLPVVAQTEAALVFRLWEGGPPAARDACGLRVPPTSARVLTPELLLMPCLGFHEDGYRLGYGGGYYDRSLAAATTPMRTLGLAFEAQGCAFAPDAHDLRMDALVTEHGVRRWGAAF